MAALAVNVLVSLSLTAREETSAEGLRCMARPNVGHERRLEACEARWKTSARWKG